jgi:hypothetical protein
MEHSPSSEANSHSTKKYPHFIEPEGLLRTAFIEIANSGNTTWILYRTHVNTGDNPAPAEAPSL